MIKRVLASILLLALLFPSTLFATYVLNATYLKKEVQAFIDEIGTELHSKTGITGYVVATKEPLPRGKSMVELMKQYSSQVKYPSITFIFAPNDRRVGLVASDESLKSLYDEDAVKDAAIGIASAPDKNSKEDKYNVAVLQAYSELADQIADAKDVELVKTIKNETKTFVFILKVIIYIGSAIVIWFYMLRPLFVRMKNGK